MDVLPDQVLRDFTALHDRLQHYFSNMTPATDLKLAEDHLHATYHMTFGVPGSDEIQRSEREAALAGLRMSTASGNKARVENRTIRMRSSTEAVVFLEWVIEKDGTLVGRSFHVESWRLLEGTWKKMRETMEVLAP